MNLLTATYSPEDNKLRLYASQRLDEDVYARVHAAGFRWAPKQDLFVAPTWTPEREDLLLELCGEIGDEDTSLVDRAETRADRFDGYADKRADEAERTHQATQDLAHGIPLGQPILVGHHSEKRARKDAEKIRRGTTKAIQLWRTAEYWERRAIGALRHAEYKYRPEVRERRIKKLEAEHRKHSKEIQQSEDMIRLWTKIRDQQDPEKQRANAIKLSNYSPASPWSTWADLSDGKITATEAANNSIAMHERIISADKRWIEHLNNRLAYERTLLGRAPDQETPKAPRRKSAKTQAPLLNYRGTVTVRSYGRDMELTTRDMTKAEYAKKPRDYKGTSLATDGSHRVRTAMFFDNGKSSLSAVFLTDSRVHEVPQKKVAAA